MFFEAKGFMRRVPRARFLRLCALGWGHAQSTLLLLELSIVSPVFFLQKLYCRHLKHINICQILNPLH